MSIAQHAEARRTSSSGWSSLFWEAFKRSRNPMVLLDERRRHVEVNGAYVELVGYTREWLAGRPVYELVANGPVLSASEWQAALRQSQFSGEAELICRDGRRVRVEFAGHPEVVTGQRLVLAVALRSARAIRRIQVPGAGAATATALSARELEVVRLVAHGLSGPEIAQELNLTHNTIRTHIRNSLTKTGARSRAHLVAKALGGGLCLLDTAGATSAQRESPDSGDAQGAIRS